MGAAHSANTLGDPLIMPCYFFEKVGVCMVGPSCSRGHRKVTEAYTIILPNMFMPENFSTALEAVYMRSGPESEESKEESDLTEAFNSFYGDVKKEFEACGKILQFKCCQNFHETLKGTVFVQYESRFDAAKAKELYNGRRYAGSTLKVKLSHVTDWQGAICGPHAKRMCVRGKLCNMLHVFRNPKGEFDVPYKTDWNPKKKMWESQMTLTNVVYPTTFTPPSHTPFLNALPKSPPRERKKQKDKKKKKEKEKRKEKEKEKSKMKKKSQDHSTSSSRKEKEKEKDKKMDPSIEAVLRKAEKEVGKKFKSLAHLEKYIEHERKRLERDQKKEKHNEKDSKAHKHDSEKGKTEDERKKKKKGDDKKKKKE